MNELERVLASAREAENHLRGLVSTNRRWERDFPNSVYTAARKDAADRDERWANAIGALVGLIEGKPR